MKRKSDEDYLSELKALYTPSAARTLELKLLPVTPIGDWLGDLRLLIGVPFTNLVANERMLPRESIRFFYVDDNWLDVLQDGATSIGLHSSRDAEHQKNMKESLSREAEIAAQQQRRRRRKKPPAESVTIGSIRTGFILRSAVVTGWPGLEVRAFADLRGEQGIDLLRLERLAPDVMICIISGERGVPARIDIDEPSEGLQFGVIQISLSQEGENPNRAIAPRWPGFTQPERTGVVITTDRRQWVPPVMRKKQGQDTRVLDVLALRANLKSKLVELGAMNVSEELKSADFALQMVKSPEQQQFLGDQTMPLTRELSGSSEEIKIERLSGIDEDAIFQELFRS
jgi:hypothetical protein